MRSVLLPALLLAATSLPATAQIISRGEGGTRVFSLPGLEASRGPRAVLGISLSGTHGIRDTAGVLVTGVTDGGPAARAGIDEGTRIQAINGVSLKVAAVDAEDPALAGIGARRLNRELGRKNPGDEVELRVATGSQSRTLRVRLADADSLYRRNSVAFGRTLPGGVLRESVRGNRASLGISVGSSGSRRDTLGVLVMGADDEGPAARAGIIEGTRIASINGVDLRIASADVEDAVISNARVNRLLRELNGVKVGDEVELRVWQNGQVSTKRVRTVASDSLRGNRRTLIVGDRFMNAPLLENFGPTRIQVGPGGSRMMPGERFRMEFDPRMLEELEEAIGRARRESRVNGVRIAAPRGTIRY